MPTILLTIHTTSVDAPDIEQLLLEQGALAISYKDAQNEPIFEPGKGEEPLWSKLYLSALFEETSDISKIKTILQTRFPHLLNYTTDETLQDQHWERAWLKDYEPVKISDKLWICPSGHTIPEKNATTVFLDPGLAFGTGTHPTTHLCLERLSKMDLSNKTIIDFGCGSGILAITAIKLGAAKIYAIDNEPQALVATIDNMQRNNISPDCIETYLPRDAPSSVNADILVANILASTLVALSSTLCRMSKPQGQIILSGILQHQTGAVITAFQKEVDFDVPQQKEEWIALMGTKKT